MAGFTIYDQAETAARLPFADLIGSLETGLAAGCCLPERHHHTLQRAGEADATLLLMPAWTNPGEDKQYLGVKLVTVVPGNAGRGLPGLVSTYMLFDGLTGEQLALMDGNTITGRRTVATSALAGKFLSRENSRKLLVCGAGRIGSLLPEAYRVVRPIEEVAVWDINAQTASRLVSGLRTQGFSAHVVDDLGEAAAGADIVCAATLATEPFIMGEWLRPGTHVDLIGSFTPKMREADDVTVARSQIYIDTAEALHESGDLVQPIAAGVIYESAVVATLADLCSTGTFARKSDDTITCFKAVGSGLADLVAAKVVMQAQRTETRHNIEGVMF